MKRTFLLFGLTLFFFFSHCSNDDDDTENVTLIGTWVLTKVSDDGKLGCDVDNPTTLKFFDNAEVVISSFDATYDKDGCRIEDFCKEEDARGDYTSGNDGSEVAFERISDNDFIPPPKNAFKYKIEENKLLVETIDPCIDPPIVYTYEKN